MTAENYIKRFKGEKDGHKEKSQTDEWTKKKGLLGRWSGTWEDDLEKETAQVAQDNGRQGLAFVNNFIDKPL